MKTDFHNYLWVGSKDDGSILIIFQAVKRGGTNIQAQTLNITVHEDSYILIKGYIFILIKLQSLGLIYSPQNDIKYKTNPPDSSSTAFRWV